MGRGWHFQTVISVEPFRGFNVIFLVSGFLAFSPSEQKAAENKWQRRKKEEEGQTSKGIKLGEGKRRGDSWHGDSSY